MCSKPMGINKKIIVFGATGKIGKNLIAYICDNREAFDVIAVGRRSYCTFSSSDIIYYSLDISDRNAFSILPTTNVFAVVDLAGAVVTSVSGSDYAGYVNANIVGAVNVFEYAQRAGADRIIYTHTYNDALRNLNGASEILPKRYANTDTSSDFSLYTITKNCAVDLLESFSNQTNISAFILRLPNIYMYLDDPYYTIAGKRQMRPFHKMIMQAINGEDIEIWGNPNHFMDMVYVKDCCQEIICALKAEGGNGGLFNVGTGRKTTLQEQVDTMIDVFSPTERRSRIVYCPEKPSGPDFVMNIDNARLVLGYTPRYSFREMLEDIKAEASKIM